MGIFRRKEKEEKPEITLESASFENLMAKLKLVLTEMDSLRTEFGILNERVKNIEKMVKELYSMAKS
jgi:hypothetical protein